MTLSTGLTLWRFTADAVEGSDRVLLVDDLLATGGTIEACLSLATETGSSRRRRGICH